MRIDFIGWLAFTVFLALKLAHAIDWSWAVVCIPLYVLAAIYTVAFVVSLLLLRKVKQEIKSVASDFLSDFKNGGSLF